uniref:Rho GTPase activating protein 15 n=1 Tax=Sus scrofa TaxID=9823 RepID=A0A8D1D1K5_PIG
MQKSTNSDTSVETLNPTRQATGAVQMRIKNANSHHDRLSQSKSMILTDVGKVTEPISRHRRNHSQHILKDVIPPLEQLILKTVTWPFSLDSNDKQRRSSLSRIQRHRSQEGERDRGGKRRGDIQEKPLED